MCRAQVDWDEQLRQAVADLELSEVNRLVQEAASALTGAAGADIQGIIRDISSVAGSLRQGDPVRGLFTASDRIGYNSPEIAAQFLCTVVTKARAAANSGQKFEVIDGVRRAKANQLLGNQNIPANIFNAEGKLVGQGDVPVGALMSPNRSAIEMATQPQVDRYMSIQRGLQEGANLPPISVTPGSRGVPISDVIFDATGGAR